MAPTIDFYAYSPLFLGLAAGLYSLYVFVGFLEANFIGLSLVIQYILVKVFDRMAETLDHSDLAPEISLFRSVWKRSPSPLATMDNIKPEVHVDLRSVIIGVICLALAGTLIYLLVLTQQNLGQKIQRGRSLSRLEKFVLVPSSCFKGGNRITIQGNRERLRHRLWKRPRSAILPAYTETTASPPFVFVSSNAPLDIPPPAYQGHPFSQAIEIPTSYTRWTLSSCGTNTTSLKTPLPVVRPISYRRGIVRRDSLHFTKAT